MRRICFLFVIFLATAAVVHAQSRSEAKTLAVGEKSERELAGREEHVYLVPLVRGQLVRVRVEQRQIDSLLVVTSPEGKQLAEMNFTEAGESEILAIESANAGNYTLTIRGVGGFKMRGSYRLEVIGQSPTEANKSFYAAQMLVLDANQLEASRRQLFRNELEEEEMLLMRHPIPALCDRIGQSGSCGARRYDRRPQ